MKSGGREKNRAELFEFLKKIKHKTVIVEGKRDKEALCSLGFTKVFAINGRALIEVAGKTKEQTIVLTDFDSEGEELAQKLSLFLRADSYSRKKLRSLFIKNKINTVQSLKKVNDYGTNNN